MVPAMQLMAARLVTCLHAAVMVLLSSLNEKLPIVITRCRVTAAAVTN
jgi:hypothetical protein